MEHAPQKSYVWQLVCSSTINREKVIYKHLSIKFILRAVSNLSALNLETCRAFWQKLCFQEKPSEMTKSTPVAFAAQKVNHAAEEQIGPNDMLCGSHWEYESHINSSLFFEKLMLRRVLRDSQLLLPFKRFGIDFLRRAEPTLKSSMCIMARAEKISALPSPFGRFTWFSTVSFACWSAIKYLLNTFLHLIDFRFLLNAISKESPTNSMKLFCTCGFLHDPSLQNEPCNVINYIKSNEFGTNKPKK